MTNVHTYIHTYIKYQLRVLYSYGLTIVNYYRFQKWHISSGTAGNNILLQDDPFPPSHISIPSFHCQTYEPVDIHMEHPGMLQYIYNDKLL